MKKSIFILSIVFSSFTSFSQTEEWVAAHTGSTGLNDAIVKTDGYGYVYVAGTLTNGHTGVDWFIAKYAPDGTELWAQSLDGGSNGDDFLKAMYVSEVGEIYLAGSFFVSDGDLALMELDPDGNQVWYNTYDGGYGDDMVKAMIVDGSGNVYVTGETAGGHSDVNITTIKYDNSGSQVWTDVYDYAHTDDAPSAMSFDSGGNILVAGYITDANGKDAAAVKYTTSGTRSWTFTYDEDAHSDDFASSLVCDGSGNTYLAGTASKSGQSYNYFTIKLNSAGSKQWGALYNGPAGNNDQANSIMLLGSYLYVTGKSKGTSSGTTTYDYATIKYNLSGSVQWTSRYNGGANGDDDAIAITSDAGGDIWITGTSDGYTGGLNYLTIRYNSSGTEIKKITYDNSINGIDNGSSLSSDGLGNIYVSGTSESSHGIFDLVTVKYADSTENVDSFKKKLDMLANGLLLVSQSDTIKNLVNASALLCVDSFFHIRIDTLIAQATRGGLSLKTRMNNQIASYYSISPADYVSKILATLWVRGQLMTAFVSIPYYANFVGTANLMNNAKLTYSHNDPDYPLPCINCSGTSTLSDANAQSNLSWNISVEPWPWTMSKRFICNCTTELSTLSSYRCKECPVTTSIGGITSSAGQNLQNYEIEADIGFVNNPNFGGDPCYQPIIPVNIPIGNAAYGRLSKISGINYYGRTGTTDAYRGIMKIANPICDRRYWGSNQSNPQNWKFGDALSLCNDVTIFNSWDENDLGTRFALAMGGVFKIERPGINQLPMYFAFPYNLGLWFGQGPDMRVYYGDVIVTNNTCSPNNEQKITEDYKTDGCEFCAVGSVVFNLSNVTDYIASTDYTTITNYWKANVVTVGFMAGTTVANANIWEFNAVTTPPLPCSSGSPLKAQLQLLSDGSYDIQRTFIGTNQTYPSGTTLTIHVVANFGSYSIDECHPITLAYGPGNSTINYTHVVAQIRGNIGNTMTSPVSYKIDVY